MVAGGCSSEQTAWALCLEPDQPSHPSRSKGGRVFLRPSYRLLCQPPWSGLIKWRLSHGSPRHIRAQCGANIITMTRRLPISVLLLSWENAPHSTPAGGRNWSGLSVILPRPEIAINHQPSWHSSRNLSGTCHLRTSSPIQNSWQPAEHTQGTLIELMR